MLTAFLRELFDDILTLLTRMISFSEPEGTLCTNAGVISQDFNGVWTHLKATQEKADKPNWELIEYYFIYGSRNYIKWKSELYQDD
ncbi:MAG: hypothetical protein AAFY76_02015 [Cyanobacteria bacterium J06649_11]